MNHATRLGPDTREAALRQLEERELDVIVIGQVVKEALQADPVGLDRLR